MCRLGWMNLSPSQCALRSVTRPWVSLQGVSASAQKKPLESPVPSADRGVLLPPTTMPLRIVEAQLGPVSFSMRSLLTIVDGCGDADVFIEDRALDVVPWPTPKGDMPPRSAQHGPFLRGFVSNPPPITQGVFQNTTSLRDPGSAHRSTQ